MHFYFRLLAVSAVYVGVEVGVRQSQGELVVQLAVRTNCNAAAIGVVAYYAVTQILIGIAVQRLNPDTCFLEGIPGGHAANAARPAAGHIADQGLTSHGCLSGATVGFRQDLLDNLCSLGFGNAVKRVEDMNWRVANYRAERSTGGLGILRTAASGDGFPELFGCFGYD